MALTIYNTLGHEKQKFEPLEEGRVKMYCCGPTVYDYLHVGNFRGAVFYNFLRNWLEHLGYQVTYVYNFTDVDDKIINRAKKENVSAEEIANRYIAEFKKDFAALELRPHDHNPRVTENMDSIIHLVQRLIDAGKAYVVDGEVLYSIASFEEYGKLSGRNPEELMSGVRIEIDQKKKDPLDFALWKPKKEGEQGWDSPWGEGRPGWHIECTAMIHSILGEQIDIHGGGMDLTFPHHENEVAQAEGCTGKQYVKYWMHNNMFTFDGAKMSKSLGNVRTMRSFLENFNGEIFKYLVLSVHYRSLTDFSDASIQRAISGLARIYSALAMADEYLAQGDEAGAPVEEFSKLIEKTNQDIEEALNNDLNTPQAFAGLFEVTRAFNGKVKRGVKAKPALLGLCRAYKDFVAQHGKILSLFEQEPKEFLLTLDNMLLRNMEIKREEVDELVKQRGEARQAKDWAKSDEIRDRLAEMKIAVLDLPGGTYWEVQK